MKAPLSLALALLAAPLALVVALEGEKPPRSFADAACDERDGSGALFRLRGDKDQDAFARDAADDGLESVDEGASSSDDGDKPKKSKFRPKPKPKPKAKAKAPKTFRLKPGKECKERLEKVTGRYGDDLDIVPDAPGNTPEKIEASFKKPGVWSRLKKIKFESAGALPKLFDNARAGDKSALALLTGAGPSDPNADAAIVKVDGTVKPNPAGSKVDDFKVKGKAPVPVQVPSTNPNLDSDEREPQRYSDYRPVAWAQEKVDGVRQYVDDKRYGTIPDNRPFTLSPGEVVEAGQPADAGGGWSMLPASGPGYKFVGRGQYGRDYVVRDLMASFADPIANAGGGWLGGGPFGVVAISLKGGGYFPPHITHQVGIDIDVALWGYHGGPLNAKAADRNLMYAVSVVEHMKPTFILLDNQRQAELMARASFLLQDPSFDPKLKARLQAAYPLLFTSGPPARGRKLFSHVENHRDHFHIEERTGRLGQ